VHRLLFLHYTKTHAKHIHNQKALMTIKIKHSVQILFVFITLLVINGCDNQNSTQNSNKNQRIVLRLGHQGTIDSAQHYGALILSEKLNKISKGTISVHIYPEGQLGSNQKLLEMTQSGQLDIALLSTTAVTKIEPAFGIFGIPFLVRNETAAHQIIDGKVGNLLFSKLSAKGLLGLTVWESGFKHILSNRHNDFILKAANLLKRDLYNPTLVNLSIRDRTQRVFKSIDLNTNENTLHSLARKNVKSDMQLTLSGHAYCGQVFLLSQLRFNAFPPKIQQWLSLAVLGVTEEQRKKAKSLNQIALEQLKSSNIEIRRNVSATQLENLNTLSHAFLEKYRRHMGTDIVEYLLQEVRPFETNIESHWLIGLDADLTSHSANAGLSIKRGIEIAIDEINQSGGWLGKPIKLIARDNALIPARGIQNIKYFNEFQNVVAVFGGLSSPVALAEVALIQKNKMLFLDPWAAATNIIDNGYEPNFIFRVSVRDEYAAPFLISEAFKQSDAVGLLLVNNPWGRSNYKALQKFFDDKDKKPTQIEWFNWGESDMDSKIQRLSDMGSDTIIYVGNSVEAIKMVKAISKLDKPIRIISHWGITGGDFGKLAKDELNKVDIKVLQTFSFINNQRPKVVDFINKYKRKYFVDKVEDIIAPVGSAHAYDLMQLLSIAVKQGQSTNPEVLQRQLEHIDSFSGLLKNYERPFSKNKHDALTIDSFILATYKNGFLVPTKVQDEFDKN
jgi:TRAP-type C4-dicarboxylate transport system substrate-binding protein